jgi:C-terminal processing protease CtpA/Prc
MPRRRVALWPALALGLVARSPAQQLSAADRLDAVATLAAHARYNFAGWDRVRADWDSAVRATLVQAVPRQTDYQFLRRLRRLTALVQDAGTQAFAPPLANRLARPPLEIRSVEGRPFIIEYLETAEMRIARPERLAEIVTVQGMPVEAWIRDSVLPEIGGASETDRLRRATAAMLDGERNTAVALTLRLPDGSVRGASVTRSVPSSDRWPFVPEPLETVVLRDSIVVVRLNSFADPDIVDRFDREFRSRAGVVGLVLDLRANDGGDSETGYQILARLSARPLLGVRRRTPRYEPFALGPITDDSLIGWAEAPPDTIVPRADRARFPGVPVAVLISGRTAGAAEDFVAAFRAAGRGVVIGERTAGATGHRMLLPLPQDWRFQVTVTRHASPDGGDQPLDGIEPDIKVEESPRALREGADPAQERAREEIAEQLRRGRP